MLFLYRFAPQVALLQCSVSKQAPGTSNCTRQGSGFSVSHAACCVLRAAAFLRARHPLATLEFLHALAQVFHGLRSQHAVLFILEFTIQLSGQALTNG